MAKNAAGWYPRDETWVISGNCKLRLKIGINGAVEDLLIADSSFSYESCNYCHIHVWGITKTSWGAEYHLKDGDGETIQRTVLATDSDIQRFISSYSG